MKTIFKGIVGSQAFGTSTETSDIDYKSVYIQSDEDILSNKYTPQTDYTPDNVGYEIRRFLELASKGNPNVLELLYLPERCIIETSPEWEYLLSIREIFLTKQCYDTFVGYAYSQLKKARGLNKKMNWEKHRTEKKDVLDFCNLVDRENGKTYRIKEWLQEKELLQEQTGLVKIDGFRDTFKVYTDMLRWAKDQQANHRYTDIDFSDRGYRGMVYDDSNEPHTSEIEKYRINSWEGIMYFNREEHSVHSREYTEYKKWQQNRNETRYVTNKKHGQQLDGKNVAHLVRLIDTAIEIPLEHKINVDRTLDRERLLSIKNGEEDLQEIIEEYTGYVEQLKEVYEKCTLPERVTDEFIQELELKLRRYVYFFVDGVGYLIPQEKVDEAQELIESFPGWMGMNIEQFKIQYKEYELQNNS